MASLLKKIFSRTTYGQITLALFAICLASGVFLAIPFDVDDPYASISLMLIANPAASLFRNLHYWSAQLFLVFTFLHMWDYFKKKENIRLKKSMWFRLSIGVLVIFLAMLTGFLLKGDADSEQALHILNSLTEEIPWIGELLAYSLLGKAGDYQLIYVHHLATFTIFIAIIVFEHSRKFWPKWGEFIGTTVIVLLLSYFFSAPLHDNLNPTVKGPWYFVGLQEVLHWLTIPGLALVFILIVLGLIYIVPYLSGKSLFVVKRSLLILTIFYLFLSADGLFLRGQNWQWAWPGEKDYDYNVLHAFKMPKVNFEPEFSSSEVSSSPLINGRKESCLVCHSNVMGMTDSHNPEALGCFACHGGSPLESDKDAAHHNMRRIPGNLADAERSCGTTNCHQDISQRINTSLMSTLSGMISVDRFVFNEQDNPDLLTDIHHLKASPADEHLKNLCVRCHLGNPKTEWGPIEQTSRGGGCLACHLNYDATTVTALLEYENNPDDTTYLGLHPSISLNVSNNHCFGCHSRSGRIATNYEGWHETNLEKEQMPDNQLYRLVENSRVFRFVEADVHHGLGMECIDCHTSYELMGDGQFYAHQEEQTQIQCSDCHFNDQPVLIDQQNLDQESAIIASLRFGDVSKWKFLATEKQNQPLVNTYYKNDSAFLLTKNNKQLFHMKAPHESCSRGEAHSTLSCSSCHTSWAPSCIGCHNEYDPEEPGFNMQENIEQKGSWVEYVGEYNAHAPALGMRIDGQSESVIPVVPGMVLTIDISGYSKSKHDSLIFQRLFAPAAPHTTAGKGRSCVSCHNDPIALGYGKGKLELIADGNTGYWRFSPHYKNNIHDGLPEDAWIGFLGKREGKVSTRSNLRPFTIEEQQSILTVGACLTCHEENSKVMTDGLFDFAKTVEARSSQCILPEW